MVLLNVILPVFAMVAAGFALEKRCQLNSKTLTDVSLYLFAPALVFAALHKHRPDSAMVADLALFMLIYTAALLSLAWGVGRLGGFNREERSALTLATSMMNVGNFGLPLVYFAFGEASLEVSIVTFVLFNIPLSTIAIFLAQGSAEAWPKAITNSMKIPIFHAVALAFLMQWLNLELPEFLLRPIELMGQAAIPMMLVLLGMQLANTRIEGQYGFYLLASGLRLIGGPLLAWGLLSMIGIGPDAARVVILQTATPAAILPLLYSLRFGTRPDLLAGAITSSTLLSGATLTVLLYLL